MEHVLTREMVNNAIKRLEQKSEEYLYLKPIEESVSLLLYYYSRYLYGEQLTPLSIQTVKNTTKNLLKLYKVYELKFMKSPPTQVIHPRMEGITEWILKVTNS
jgi:hypothetical protein